MQVLESASKRAQQALPVALLNTTHSKTKHCTPADTHVVAKSDARFYLERMQAAGDSDRVATKANARHYGCHTYQKRRPVLDGRVSRQCLLPLPHGLVFIDTTRLHRQCTTRLSQKPVARLQICGGNSPAGLEAVKPADSIHVLGAAGCFRQDSKQNRIPWDLGCPAGKASSYQVRAAHHSASS